jgi:cyclohexanone monooxygenase
MNATSEKRSGAKPDCDVVIVGAGFAGMYAIYKLRQLGRTMRAFEKGAGVGGTWYWNRYPGARVDLESCEYSYTFSKELEHDWRWSEHYSPQPELLRYANYVADRFDLRRDIQFETTVTAMVFDEKTNLWTVTTDKGDRVTAKYCLMASGALSMPKDIDIPGMANFKGKVYRTNLWPKEEIDFTGQRVAVIGTGSSGIQAIPEIAKQAAHLTVYQRTANFSLPTRNRVLTQDEVDAWLAHREENRDKQRNSRAGTIPVTVNPPSARSVSDAERLAIYEKCYQMGGFGIGSAFNDHVTDKWANDQLSEFIRNKIRATVKDPWRAEKLCPFDHPVVTKRPCIDTGYYETFNQDHVDLIDVRETPIETITANGIRVAGKERAFDSIVLAIGFDAMTGALNAIDIRGRGGVRLKDQWRDGPRTYLGLAIAGFPNMFTVTGPGSPSVLANVIIAIEQHVDWIAGCIDYADAHGVKAVEATPDAQENWVQHVNDVAKYTLYPLANSWYVGANVPGKTRVFMPYIGGFNTYCAKCKDVAEKGYEGFNLIAA